MSSFIFQGHQEVTKCNSNSRIAMKGHTQLLEAWEGFPIVFQGHPLKFKVTRAESRRFGSDLGKITRPVAAIKICRVIFVIIMFALELMECIFLGFLGVGLSLVGLFGYERGIRLGSGVRAGALIYWHDSGHFSLKEDSSMKMPVEAQSISDALTW